MIEWMERMGNHVLHGYFFALGVYVFLRVACEFIAWQDAIEVVK